MTSTKIMAMATLLLASLWSSLWMASAAQATTSQPSNHHHPSEPAAVSDIAVLETLNQTPTHRRLQQVFVSGTGGDNRDYPPGDLQIAFNAWCSDAAAAEATYGPINRWDTSQVTDMSFLFYNVPSADRRTCNPDISSWDVSSVTTMSRMFSYAYSFNRDLSGWIVSSVTTMNSMFQGASSFNRDLSAWIVSSVTTMYQMFIQASSFNRDLSGWIVSSVTDMRYMFEGASSFSQTLCGGWHTSSATKTRMFEGNSGSTTANCASCTVSGVSAPANGALDSQCQEGATVQHGTPGCVTCNTGFTLSGTQAGCNNGAWSVGSVACKEYQVLYSEGWCDASNELVGNTDSVDECWAQCSNYFGVAGPGESRRLLVKKELEGGGAGDARTLVAVDWWPNLDGECYCQDACTILDDCLDDTYETAYAIGTDLPSGLCGSDGSGSGSGSGDDFFGSGIDLSGDVPPPPPPSVFVSGTGGEGGKGDLQTAMNAWCLDATAAEVTYGPINDWDTSQVTDMSYLFKNVPEADRVTCNPDISGWDVSSVTNMERMFEDASLFNQDLSNWNVGSVTNMFGMFAGASSFDQPLNNWNVGSVTNMDGTFKYASKFNQALNNWNVGSVTTMNGMFLDASSFNQPLSNWNVGSVTNMYNMFKGATSFNQALSNWNVGSVTNMKSMFKGASSFSQTLCGGWHASSQTSSIGGLQTFDSSMFFDSPGSTTANCEPCPATAAAKFTTPSAVESATGTGIAVTCATGYSTSETAECNPDSTWRLPTCTDTAGCDGVSCGTGAICTDATAPNTGYTCSCGTGYTGDDVVDGSAACEDVDECTASTDTCDANAACTNTAGSFTCACNAGYSGDGVTCTDSHKPKDEDGEEHKGGDGYAGNDPWFRGADGQMYKVDGVAGETFNVVTSQSVQVNAVFIPIPEKFKSEDLTDNVMDEVGLSYCVRGAHNTITLSPNTQPSPTVTINNSTSGSVSTPELQLFGLLCTEPKKAACSWHALSSSATSNSGIMPLVEPGALLDLGARKLKLTLPGVTVTVMSNFNMHAEAHETGNRIMMAAQPGAHKFYYSQVVVESTSPQKFHGLLGQRLFPSDTLNISTTTQVAVVAGGGAEALSAADITNTANQKQFEREMEATGLRGMPSQGEGFIQGTLKEYQLKHDHQALHSNQFQHNLFDPKCM